MRQRVSKAWGGLLFSAAVVPLLVGACMAPDPGSESSAGDEDAESGALPEEEIGEAEQGIAITRVIPIRFVEPMSCKPGTLGCFPNANPDVLRGAVDRANTVFADAGIKFWIKSIERYFLPKFATKNQDSYSWSAVKNAPSGTTQDSLRTVFPAMESASYSDTETKSTGGWMQSASAFYGDPDEILIWVVDPGTDLSWDDRGRSYGMFPERGRHIVIVAPNLDADDGTIWWATTHLGHEIGHFFGVRHPEDGLAGTNPVTDAAWTYADQWDLLYCKASSGQPTHFFTSKADFQAYGCSQANLGRILKKSNCTSADPFGIVSCTIDGQVYSTGNANVDTLLWQDTSVVHDPPTSIRYGTNVMSYYSYYPTSGGQARDTRAPSRFSGSQLAQIAVYKDSSEVYYPEELAIILRSDLGMPAGGRLDGMASSRYLAGTAAEDMMWWSNGDLTFKNETKPISGTNYTPVSGDFDNNGFDDICWYDPATGNAWIWWSNGNKTFTAQIFSFGAGFQIFAGNFDAVNGDDLFFYAPGSTADKILWANGNKTFTTEAKTVSGTYTPVTGNFDGQGGDDIFWYSPSAGTVNIWWAVGSTKTFTGQNNVSVGTGFTPIAGNFDGLIGTDIFWYAPGAAADALWFSNTDKTFDVRSASVIGTYKPVAGDFNGDGADDIFWDADNATTDYIWRAVWNRSAPFDTSGRASVYGSFKAIPGKFDGTWQGKNATDIFWYRN